MLMKYYMVNRPFKMHNGPLFPTGTTFVNQNGNIIHDGKFMCLVGSEHAHQCLIGNDDNQWAKRAILIEDIQKLVLAEDIKDKLDRDDWIEIKEKRLLSLWSSSTAMKYSRGGTPETDAWLWSDDYYCAKISDLEKIKKMLNRINYTDKERANGK